MIRGLRKTEEFQKSVHSRLNAQIRCELAGLAATAWLNLRLQIIALLVVSGVILTALVGRGLDLIDVNHYYLNTFQ